MSDSEKAAAAPGRGRLITGVVLMLVGLLFLLDRFLVLDIGSLEDFWPVILITIGAVKLSRPGASSSSRGWGGFWILLGTWLLLDEIDLYEADESWPVFLMAGGAMMVASSLRRHDAKPVE